ncbi:hypothetical protein GE061_008144 [Apolygus lucorum]|uniref:G-protein coupled receptors family 1 profile domain-containing protein n=1 Tax=Apolygus lucorum TaxID=248454 RepID=A0A8S9WRG8_APOLU|nr:hypothetical protein GE061_008144 [Apolygus lucorum]
MGMKAEDEEEWRNMDPLYCELGSIGMVSQLGRREETGSPRLSLRESADTVLPSTFRVVMAPPSPPHHGGSEELPIVTFEERFTPETALETLNDGALTSPEKWNRGVSSEVTAALCAGQELQTVSPLIYTQEGTGSQGVTPGVSPGVTQGVSPLIYTQEGTGSQGVTPGVLPGVTQGVSPLIYTQEATGTQGVTPGVSPGVTQGVSPLIYTQEATGTQGVTPGVSPGVTQDVSPLIYTQEGTGTQGVSPLMYTQEGTGMQGVTPGVSPGVTQGVSPLIYTQEGTGTQGGTPGVSPGVSPLIYTQEGTEAQGGTPGVSPGVTQGVSPPINTQELTGTQGGTPGVAPEDIDELDYTTTALYEANSTSGEQINHFYFYVTEQLVVLWILFLFIVLGNSAVLLALSFSKNRKSRMNYFIMQLAIADLAVGLISVSTDIVWKITVEWHAGNFACKLIRYSQAVVTYSSTYVLVALSIDRYDAIKHPMRFSGSWRRARILVAVAWVLSALFSLPIFFLYEEKLIQNQLQCWIEMGALEWQLYMTSVSAALFFIPAIIITACYAVIVSTIWSKGSTAIVVKRKTKGFHDKVRLDNEDSRRASSRGLIPRAKIKTIKMTFVIVFVFIVCWSPYILFDLLQVYGYVPQTQTNTAIATFVQSLAPLNSAANPLIYCLFSTRICRSLKKFAPFSWIFGKCCPSVMTEHSCRYAGDFSSTMTTSVTHSRRSPALTSSFHTSRRRGTLL